MYESFARCIDQLASNELLGTDVIPWGSPVPVFGDPELSEIATLGINPSNREFVDEAGREIVGLNRRFQTLSSLGLSDWQFADARHIGMMMDSCRTYFTGNPYDRWFRRLDRVLLEAGASYYSDGPLAGTPKTRPACHLDLVPFATNSKWTDLTSAQRSILLSKSGNELGKLLQRSPISVVVLNGRSVVERVETMLEGEFERSEQPDWALPRRTASPVIGISYKIDVKQIGGVKIGRDVRFLGYNHNIQSSFGVTNEVIDSIANWIGEETH